MDKREHSGVDSERSDEIRSDAQAVGERTLEMHANTPQLNAWYYSKFQERIGGRVLELGSGIGNLSRLLAQDSTELFVTDVEDTYVARLNAQFQDQKHVQALRYNLEKSPPATFAPESFDVVLSCNVLEHVLDDERAVADLTGLLKPGGWLLTYVPAMSLAYGTLDRCLGHHRRYDAHAFAALMQRANLQVERLGYMNLPGLLGWVLNGQILKKTQLDSAQVHLFERLVPAIRLFDTLPLPLGLGLVCHAQKPTV